MSRVYVIGSIPNQGKTTMAISLAKHFTSLGERVACMQVMKGQYDVGHYLHEGCYHYSLPLEALRSKETLAEWLPIGYDVHTLEVSFPYSPVGACYVSLFDSVNEIIGIESRENWEEYVKGILLQWFKCPEILKLWDIFHDRNVFPVVTKTDGDIGQPCVDKNLVVHHVEKLVYDEIEPKMSLPKSKKRVLAVGAFPAEFFDMFPCLTWYEYRFASFVEALKGDGYDLSIIGTCIDSDLTLDVSSTTKPVYCYQPSALSDRVFIRCSKRVNMCNPLAVLDGIRNLPVGSNFWGADPCYTAYSNRLWVYKAYSGDDIIERDGHVIFCNGWVLPQHLVKEGILEV